MSKVTALAVCEYAHSQQGYTEGSNNWNKYADALDHAKPLPYFYPQKKQGEPWCCCYVDACIFAVSGNDKAKTDAVLYQPAKENYSAVVKYLAGYFKTAKAYFTDVKALKAGDVVFFNAVDSKGKVTSKYSHTGLVISVGANSFRTSEGNKNNKVQELTYSFALVGFKVEGFGRPKYDDDEPTPTPPTDFYRVTTQTGDTLKLRKEPTTKSAVLTELKPNTTIKAEDIVKGEDIKGCNVWVKTTSNGFTGYSSGKYLSPTPQLPPEPTPTYPQYEVKTNTGKALRLRAQPTTKSDQIGWTDNGEVVKVETIQNNWGYIDRTGAKGGGALKGWSSMTYLKKI